MNIFDSVQRSIRSFLSSFVTAYSFLVFSAYLIFVKLPKFLTLFLKGSFLLLFCLNLFFEFSKLKISSRVCDIF